MNRCLPVIAVIALLVAACGGGGNGGSGGGGTVPPTLSFTATATTIHAGLEGTTLSWTAGGADACLASGGWSGTKPVSASESLTPAATTTYTLTCSNAAGSVQRSITVTVIPPPPAPTVTFSANPPSIDAGDTARLEWTSTNATSCRGVGDWQGPLPTAGSQIVGPLYSSRTYILVCEGPLEGASATVTVDVSAVPVTVAGTLLIPDFARMDSDTNTALTTPESNNTFSQAQVLPTPVQLAGYLNTPGSGPGGQLHFIGDLDDFYRVSLLQGQTITLTATNDSPTADDLDLELYSSSQQLVDGSYSTGRTEYLVVPQDGEYFLRVFVVRGASIYSLSVGQVGGTASAQARVLSRSFEPDRLIVRTRGMAGTATAKANHEKALQRSSLKALTGSPERERLVAITAASVSAATTHLERLGNREARRFSSGLQRRKWETLQVLKLLERDPEIERVEANWILSTAVVPNDPHYTRQRWHYELVHLPAAWDLTVGNDAITVAVVDTGVQTHMELAPKIRGGFDFVVGSNAGDGDGIDPDPGDPGQWSGSVRIFHGTHVAGTIAARTNDSVGVAGVAWDARIMPVRVLGTDGTGTLADVIQGIRYAAGLPNDSGTTPPQRADVINLSFGAAGACPSVLAEALSAARDAGAIVVAAAGNSNRSEARFPAGCPGVVSVAAVDAAASKAPYSSFGAGVDLAAPGGDGGADLNGDGYPDAVYSTFSRWYGSVFHSSYEFLQGTSMAAPHVSGIAALMRSVRASLTPLEFDQLLASGALTRPLPDSDLGGGLIDARISVLAAANGQVPARPGQLSVWPDTVNFGATLNAGEVQVTNRGTESVAVISVVSTHAWLSAQPVAVDSNGLGTYQLLIDRTGLDPGTYSAVVEFVGDPGIPAMTTVLMQVSASPDVADAGMNYVLLVDLENGGGTGRQEYYRARGPSVDFFFHSVKPGRYLLVAGTDLDNNGFICDEGESCGRYPILSDPTPLVILENLAGLRFPIGYRVSFGTQVAGTAAPLIR